ncbi:hypothetical protein PPYR_04259 [Photinus pyralis]|uniref:Uncharacterized protein n=2 Tax=Photinus pyralis TaxID=7054 RepID=A0A5N4AXR0_PHOPY|nr:uncharacterized protein LOC116163185 [Photinus pyralis]KAB0802073.1 hypothetical protein PPYR_04259 [Photinus pyralis]
MLFATDLRTFHRHHKELWPIIGLIGAAVTGYIFTAQYMLRTRPDVVWYKGQREDRYPQVLRQPYVHKLIKINERYTPNPALADLYEEMARREKELIKSLQQGPQRMK